MYAMIAGFSPLEGLDAAQDGTQWLDKSLIENASTDLFNQWASAAFNSPSPACDATRLHDLAVIECQGDAFTSVNGPYTLMACADPRYNGAVIYSPSCTYYGSVSTGATLPNY